MKNQTNQITPQGIANRSGLEVFVTEEIYSGEYINRGNALAYGSQLGSDISLIVSGDDPDAQYTALTKGEASEQWKRYYTTTGTNHYVGTPPTRS